MMRFDDEVSIICSRCVLMKTVKERQMDMKYNIYKRIVGLHDVTLNVLNQYY